MLSGLLERDRELVSLDEALAAVRSGSGRVVLIEGAAGIGKSALLGAACGRARTASVCALTARGAELERDLAFGVVRQLFEGLLARLPARERERLLGGAARLARPVLLLEREVETGADPFAALHGLYWLCANLAEHGPLALFVDDAHWADRSSLRWFGYLGGRIDSLPVLLVLVVRSGEPAEETQLLRSLASHPAADRLLPAPLSEHACAELVRRELGGEANPEFSRACQASTGGNPFYLRELLTAARDAHLVPTAEGASGVRALAPKTIARSVLLRLGRLGANGIALARAVAVLGPDAELRHAAALAGLDAETAQLTADELSAAQILAPVRPLAFVHPIVQAAIASDFQPGTRSIEHRRAARLLHASGLAPDRVALHLMATDPAADPWVLGSLREAAAWSRERSAPEAAASFLRRALAEPPDTDSCADLLLELGRVEQLHGDENAIAHLTEAVQISDGARARAARSIDLVNALHLSGRLVEAVAACDRALAALGDDDHELVLRLEAMRCRAGINHPATAESDAGFSKRFGGTITGRTPGEREALAQVALQAAGFGTSAAEVADTIELALADGALFDEHGGDSMVVHSAVVALTYADRLDEGEELAEQALADVRRRGSLTGYVHATTFRALIRLRRGRVLDAEADAHGAVAAMGMEASAWVMPGTFSILLDSLLERGDLQGAVDELDRFGLHGEPPPVFPFTMLLHSRALLRLAAGRPGDALADALLCGSRQDALGVSNPSILPWRSTAALANAATGDVQDARRLADEEVRLARAFGAPRALGLALRVAGLVADDERRLRLLADAVDVLSASPARLEHAHALVDLGTALRHAKHVSPARERLREGLDLARRCAAGALAERAREELIIAGARPRRDALRGRDALTASELRVARMATEGMTNREIAQALFITTKTVEAHLHHAFRKLEIESRAQLGAALGRSTLDTRAMARRA